MAEVEGTGTFRSGGDAYDSFMGRYSRPLAGAFADFVGVESGSRVLDVGCGPGAWTTVLVQRTGAPNVSAIDPTPEFVAACRLRLPGVDVRQEAAEHLSFDDRVFDGVGAQLVFHFVSEPGSVVAEMVRVVRPGGVVAACVWDFDEGMEMLRCFWAAVGAAGLAVPDDAEVLRLGRAGELAELFDGGGLVKGAETTLRVSSSYETFDDLWNGFLAGVGPAGAYCQALPSDRQAAVRDALFVILRRPSGGFTLDAVARAARGVRR